MRTDLIQRGTYTAGQTINYTIGKGHLNGLMFLSTSNSLDATLTLRRRGVRETKVLANNLRISEAFRISDLEFGYNYKYGQMFEQLYADLKAAAVTGFTTDTKLESTYEGTISGEMGLYFYYVDLGSLFLGTDSELVINFQVGSTMTAGNYGIWSVSARRVPDFMFQYDVVTDFDSTQRNVDAIYLGNTGTKATFLEVNDSTKLISYEAATTVQLEDHNGPYISDLTGMLCATLIFGQTEGFADQRMVLLYKRPDSLPATVYCKVTGLPVGGGEDWRLIVRRFVADDLYVSTNTIEEATLFTRRLAELEQRDPALAKALRHRGDVPSSTTLAAQIVAVAGNA